MRLIDNLGSEAEQIHTIPLDESGEDIILTLRYYSTIQAWYMDLEWGEYSTQGVKVSVGVFHIFSGNVPFEFRCVDNSGNGIDPYALDDFQLGRCQLVLVEPDEMAQIRGVEVDLQSV